MAIGEIGKASSQDAFALALAALSWTLAEAARADRLLALTGLTPDDLRSRVNDPSVLAAILGFVIAHEPDLIACSKAIDARPADLVSAQSWLEAQTS